MPFGFCYSYMFYGCTNLVNAPELPATTLADYCYLNMFYDCTKLNYIKMLATDISAEECLGNWVLGVSPTGTFIKNKDATWDVRGVNGIPEGWVVLNDGEESGGGNDFGIEFPLYLEFDYCEEDLQGTFCYRNADEIGVKLCSALKDIAYQYGVNEEDSIAWYVSSQILNMLGVEIYLENIKIVEYEFIVYNEGVEEIFLTLEDGSFVSLLSNGEIFKEL